jgi:hypothetical protein
LEQAEEVAQQDLEIFLKDIEISFDKEENPKPVRLVYWKKLGRDVHSLDFSFCLSFISWLELGL